MVMRNYWGRGVIARRRTNKRVKEILVERRPRPGGGLKTPIAIPRD